MTFSITIIKCITQHNDNANANHSNIECHNQVYFNECSYAKGHYAEWHCTELSAAYSLISMLDRYCFGSQLPCPKCLSSCYCSLECLDVASSSFHRHECLSSGGIVSNFLEDFLIKVKLWLYTLILAGILVHWLHLKHFNLLRHFCNKSECKLRFCFSKLNLRQPNLK